MMQVLENDCSEKSLNGWDVCTGGLSLCTGALFSSQNWSDLFTLSFDGHRHSFDHLSGSSSIEWEFAWITGFDNLTSGLSTWQCSTRMLCKICTRLYKPFDDFDEILPWQVVERWLRALRVVKRFEIDPAMTVALKPSTASPKECWAYPTNNWRWATPNVEDATSGSQAANRLNFK